MPEGQVLEFTHVTKRFNEVTAVSDFSARVEPGAVTAFLGPNGAGKTTTLRILLGQVRATSGTATIGGTAYAELRQPLRTIGAVLEETVYRPRRTAERQLTIAAKANGIPLARVGEVLSLVGLDGEGDSRIGGFSLGMRQRLSVAHALLGDPGALVFDEPANGLDPEGIRWMRLLMRRLADEGRTVLVSSHVLSEVEQVADNVLVLSKGQLVLASGIETLADPKGGGSVIVDAADRGALTAALSAAGFDVEVLRSGLTVRGGDAGTVGAVAADAGIALSTLVQRGPTLEDVFIDLMRGGRLAPPTAPVAPQLVAPVPAEVAPAEPASAEPVSAAADSVVAIPVAAAAAWAAEAAAAPADEAVADDLAASAADGAAVEEEAPANEAPAEQAVVVEHTVVEDTVVEEETPAEDATEDDTDQEASADDASAEADSTEADSPEADSTEAHASGSEAASVGEAHAEGEQERDAQTDEAPAEETPARSFDEILFGSAAPAADDEATALGDDDLAGAEDHAGVEVFADLNTAAAPDAEDVASDAEDVVADAEGASDDDPRSAAVSSMLAAAARAYYEDEPKDYPLNTEDPASEDPAPEGDSAAESAHWTVASTGVIDTVPQPESAEAVSEEHTSEEHGSEEHTPEEHDSEEHTPEEHGSEEHTSEEHGSEEHGSEENGSEGSVAADETEAENRDEHEGQTDGENDSDGENHHS
ncbi:MAG: ATP-binding cassette domain-containing protein [Microbacterium sp.]